MFGISRKKNKKNHQENKLRYKNVKAIKKTLFKLKNKCNGIVAFFKSFAPLRMALLLVILNA